MICLNFQWFNSNKKEELYVKLHIHGPYMYTPFQGRDVAFNTIATGATPYQHWLPGNAVDGRYLGLGDMTERARGETCYASVSLKNPWWTIDLGSSYDILDVLYYGRENKYLGMNRYSCQPYAPNLAKPNETI